MSEFVPRLVAPDVSIDYYRHTGYYREEIIGYHEEVDPETGQTILVPDYAYINGLNECLLIDSDTGEVMPNCVGYAWGRWYEISDIRPNLSRGNAQNWYGYTQDGYERRKTAVNLGAVACFVGGNIGGHVSIVEERISP